MQPRIIARNVTSPGPHFARLHQLPGGDGHLRANRHFVNAFGFGTLPATAPDPAFAQVTQFQSIATSNYNGLVTSLRHNFDHGFQFAANYTWSHALDELSNAGLLPVL